MKVLVTGGRGFIGRWVVDELIGRGHQPVVFDRKHEPLGVFPESVFGDIRDSIAVHEAMAHVEGYVHLAGVLGTQETIQHPRAAAETNVIGGLNVLEAASANDLPGVYIAVGNHWMENTYSITKTTVERFCRMYRDERDLRVSVVRAFNAYGPGQSVAHPFGPSKVRKIMPSFICRALVGQDIEIYGDGSQIMDMIYVSDVARILVETLERTTRGAEPEVVEAGTGVPTTVFQIAETVSAEVTGLTGFHVGVSHLPMRPGEPESSRVIAIDRDPTLIGLEDGVRRTVKYFHDGWLQAWRSSIASG